MSVSIKRLVIDALKPREVNIVDLSKALCQVHGTQEADVVVTEVNAKTETIKVVVRGANIDYEGMVKAMNDFGASIRGVDEVNIYRKGVPEKR